MDGPLSLRKRVAFTAVTLVACIAFVEGTSWAAIHLAKQATDIEIRRTRDVYREQTARVGDLLEDRLPREVLDPELGWRYRPGYRAEDDTISGQGLRGSREYAQVPSPGVLRVAAFGDSFVYGNEVASPHAWPAAIERFFPEMEVLNYGVGGYGTDQAFLRFEQEGTLLAPHMVLVGFTPVDLRRVVNVYRRFISDREFAFGKPRFALGPGDELILRPNPLAERERLERLRTNPRSVRELGEDDQWYRGTVYENPLYDWSATVRLLTTLGIRVHDKYVDPDRLVEDGLFRPSSTAFRIQAALFERFAEGASESGALPVVVLLPDRSSIVRGMRGETPIYAPLLERLEKDGVPALDLLPAFLAAGSEDDIDAWFMEGGHYSPLGNEVVARWLGPQLATLAGHPPPS